MRALAAALKELASGLTSDAQLAHAVSGRGEESIDALRDLLYTRYFCRWDSAARSRTRYSDRASGEPAFVAQLVAAAHGATCWEPGWRVSKADGEWAFVSNGRLNLFLDDRNLLDPKGAALGAPVRVRMPCARENLSAGFFYLVGRAGPIDRGRPHFKLYLNLAPEGAAPLVEALLWGPRLERLRFEAKMGNAPGAYCRVDTALLYAEGGSYPGLLAFLRAQRRSHPSWWREGTPLFTRALGPGLAVAESPAGSASESFGQQRCRLLAEEILSALSDHDHSAAGWLARVVARFAREGLPLEGMRPAAAARRRTAQLKVAADAVR